ncbi:MAG: hypothetical protein IH609_08400 [Dehalococcoidia bacterium]|nr:hypothetical protein [Dehalococcoidia bacterium]
MRNPLRLALAAVPVVALFGASAALAAGSGGVSGPAFYVDGELYRTVGTPSDLTATGAPADSFDTLYQFNGAQPNNVVTAGPGDPGFNGGRWRVQVLHFTTSYADALADHDRNASGDFDSNEEVEAAIAAGDATTSEGPSFECPVIPVPKGSNS